MKHIRKFEDYEINEGIKSSFLKAISSAMILFNAIKKFDFKDFSITMSSMNKLIDIIDFVKRQETWVIEDYDLDELKAMASKYNIDEKYPTIGDIFFAKYKKEKKRDLKADIDFVIEHLEKGKKDVNDPELLAKGKKILQFLEDLKDL
jgi:hypothetical protein